MRALVTGAGGFLGRYVVEQLVARGDHVRGLCRRPCDPLQRLGVEVVQGDIRDRDAVMRACQTMDAVFHVAAIAGIWGPWRDFYEINVLGTQHVVDGCREHGVSRLVYTSSPSVTFDGSDQRGCDESVPYARNWLCHYPHTKAMAEQRVLAASGGGDLLSCALRPHLIWGPRDTHLVPRLIDRARSGQLRRVGSGTNRIDTVYVENAAAAHLLAVDRLVPGSPVAGRAYFITQGEPVNCWEWIDALLSQSGLPPVRKQISFRAAWIAGGILETVYRVLGRSSEPRMTRFLAAQLARDHYFNIDRARQDLGYRPTISTDEGMRRLAACQCPEN